jgi:hypothetical protein
MGLIIEICMWVVLDMKADFNSACICYFYALLIACALNRNNCNYHETSSYIQWGIFLFVAM